MLGVLLHLLAAVPRAERAGPEPAGPADEALMARFIDGDARAFETLVGRHKKPVYHFIYRFVRQREMADEIFQDSLLKVVRAASSYQRGARFTVWLYTIVRNTIYDRLRRERHRRQIRELDRPLEPGGGTTLGDTLAGVSPEGEEEARTKQLEDRLATAVARLNPDQREVFLMRQHQGLAFKEIAEIMGCPVNTAKTRMRYALESLQRELAEFA
ncbi:MAG: RNA polymerase sigma factor [Deltaproteobacteria bacterium]|nr:RNA polymerase sigma factor [Deltaproteobacteria bacterium]